MTSRRRPFPIEKLLRIIDHPSIPSYDNPTGFNAKQRWPCWHCWVTIRYLPRRSRFPFLVLDNGTIHHDGLREKLYRSGNRVKICHYGNFFAFEIQNIFCLQTYLDFQPLFDVARDLESVDFVVQQYWENPHASRLYELPKAILREIVRYIFWDDVVERNFVYRAPPRRSARLGL